MTKIKSAMKNKPIKLRELRKILKDNQQVTISSPSSAENDRKLPKRSHADMNRPAITSQAATPTPVASDIDDLFQQLKTSKKQKQEQDVLQAKVLKQEETRKASKQKLKASLPRIVNPEAPIERIDKESGYPVYKAHLLKVGEGGGTPLCPFDCNCCF
jgi:hypothetical protein